MKSISTKSPRIRKLLFGLGITAALAGIGAVVVGTTNALYSATQTSATNTFNSGTVSVGLGSTSTTCAVTNMVPGDSSTGYGSGSQALTQCNYKVKYTGSATAWLAVDVAVNAGSTPLYTATADGLQVLVKTTSGVTLMNNTTFKNPAGTDTTLAAGALASNLLLSASPAVTNDEFQFNIDYLLPLLASNATQGGAASITLTFHAVQSGNQPILACVAGRQCNTITWS
ncbi:MAG: M73 family metallopeptidase [Acidobacteria bacterium]|nr:M73 family metallopeptidase [Acidobacteriota bacterium]